MDDRSEYMTPESPVAIVPTRRSGAANLSNQRWFGPLVTFSVVLIILAVCVEIYCRACNFGARVVQSHPVEARIEISNPPAYLDRRIVQALLDEAYQFARKDSDTYHRVRNILDGQVLKEFAGLYTDSAGEEGKSTDRQSVGFNAWIKGITQVQRTVSPDKSFQTIQIFAEWRQPAAWISVGDAMYLIDAQGTRLPGVYRPEDRAGSRLMAITGLTALKPDGPNGIPAPGRRWDVAENGAMSGDLAAGMELVGFLQTQRFAWQIDAVDMANFSGRQDARGPWIVLNTIWEGTAGGGGRATQVYWGRPIGEEKYYEVQAEAKLKTLNEVFLRFNRIDAGRDYVDIRTEVVRLPKLASENGAATAGQLTRAN